MGVLFRPYGAHGLGHGLFSGAPAGAYPPRGSSLAWDVTPAPIRSASEKCRHGCRHSRLEARSTGAAAEANAH